MKLRRVLVQNLRSFLGPEELKVDGDISIVIGPNGGGKTNLIDAAITMIRRHLLISWSPRHSPTNEWQDRYEFVRNETLNSVRLEKHRRGASEPQVVEIELEVTEQDVANIAAIKAAAAKVADFAEKKYVGADIRVAAEWDLSSVKAGQRITYRFQDHQLQTSDKSSDFFRSYLALFEVDSSLRAQLNMGALSTPMLSLPVHRGASGFQSTLALANYNEFDVKRGVDAANSRQGGSIGQLAIGRLAARYRLLLEEDSGGARERFKSQDEIKTLTKVLKSLGYDWDLESVNPLLNQYDIRLSKQGTSFLVDAASSGEKEILTYLFGIYALNVRDALIFIDEPELHLHPKWQGALLKLFEDLTVQTGNQFILATHSPVFVSPSSIQYVSRVFSENQQSKVVRLNNSTLPDAKHLFAIVNSHNNESIFFADKIILVEGISDKLFFDAVFKRLGVTASPTPVFEIISVGGKGYFKSYESILNACRVPYVIIADRDYARDVGTSEIKNLFALDGKNIKKDVIENIASMDGDALAARLEDAIQSRDLEDLEALWTYIKSRRQRLKSDLTGAEEKEISNFLNDQKEKSVFILREGALEDYLPVGYRSKDVDKLIRFLSSDFWNALSASVKAELEALAKAIS